MPYLAAFTYLFVFYIAWIYTGSKEMNVTYDLVFCDLSIFIPDVMYVMVSKLKLLQYCVGTEKSTLVQQ